jgi:hypothetical protein
MTSPTLFPHFPGLRDQERRLDNGNVRTLGASPAFTRGIVDSLIRIYQEYGCSIVPKTITFYDALL